MTSCWVLGGLYRDIFVPSGSFSLYFLRYVLIQPKFLPGSLQTWVPFYFAGRSRTLCSFIPDVMVLLLLLPSVMELVLLLLLLRSLPEPNGGLQMSWLLSLSAEWTCLGPQGWQGTAASVK